MRIVRHTADYSYELFTDVTERLNIVQKREKMYVTLTDEIEIHGYDQLRQLRDDLSRFLESALVD